MELLDRDYQRHILRELSEIYPKSADIRSFLEERPERQVLYNLHYLCEHRLVSARWDKTLDGDVHAINPQITAAGIDFITDDGGLSAILGVVTVKIHEDTLKALLIGKVESTEGDPTTKKLLIEKIKGMPAEALSTVTERALDSGLDQLPDLLGSLSKWLGL